MVCFIEWEAKGSYVRPPSVTFPSRVSLALLSRAVSQKVVALPSSSSARTARANA